MNHGKIRKPFIPKLNKINIGTYVIGDSGIWLEILVKPQSPNIGDQSWKRIQ